MHAGSSVGADIMQQGKTTPVGTLLAVDPATGAGLAHLRLAPALAAMQGDAVLQVAGGQQQSSGSSNGEAVASVVMPHRPQWWPAEWGYEEQQLMSQQQQQQQPVGA